MTSNPVYLVEGVYPDPHHLMGKVSECQNEEERKELLEFIRSADLSTHPLLEQLFVES